ncbi:MAG: hypothetical protein B7Z72_12865 [Gemmatimonadetes bacterium 21-71-4]|nr:MAG: hypothetical protein B7Z72_12865 [Gemmatimonadetes bacterium 21-71-4]
MAVGRGLRESALSPREALVEQDARALAVALLEMSQADFSAAFSGSPMKRAKFTGLKRNASVVLGSPGTEHDVPALAAALADPAPLVRRQAAWALGAMGLAAALAALLERLLVETDPSVADAIGALGMLRSAAAVFFSSSIRRRRITEAYRYGARGARTIVLPPWTGARISRQRRTSEPGDRHQLIPASRQSRDVSTGQ